MKLHAILTVPVLALASVALAPTGEVRVEPDQNNVTAGRLVGTWEADPLVAKRMGCKPSADSFEFGAGDEFLSRIPAKYDEVLAKLRFYESGQLIIRREGRVKGTHPYLLSVIAGNPHLLIFRERDGDPLGDIESMNLFVAPGKNRTGDILLMGGDFNNQPFKAFRRRDAGK
jgi:hypothetical protein